MPSSPNECDDDFRPCPWKRWGNSVLAINYKFWDCTYCGTRIKDGTPFQVMRIDDKGPFVYDTEFCMIQHIRKLEMEGKRKQ